MLSPRCGSDTGVQLFVSNHNRKDSNETMWTWGHHWILPEFCGHHKCVVPTGNQSKKHLAICTYSSPSQNTSTISHCCPVQLRDISHKTGSQQRESSVKCTASQITHKNKPKHKKTQSQLSWWSNMFN